jgi:citrate lyase subunit beta / citryl-CoA lyase
VKIKTDDSSSNTFIMNSKVATAGNSGPKVRSDCEISIELTVKGGIVIDLSSKVKALYGDSILSLGREVLFFYGIKNANVIINDSGALPYVICARLEAAIKKLVVTDKDYLPEMLADRNSTGTFSRRRFSRLYVPGNTPSMIINAGLHSADGIILDLEDSVAPEKKDEARILVRNALRQINFGGAERMVRINKDDTGKKDLHAVIPQNLNLILIPKCENKDDVLQVDAIINEIRKKLKIRNNVFLMPIIESALGIENSFEIARASDNIVAMAIGLEDYTADLGVVRTSEGKESLYARTRLVNAAKAAGIQPVDSVFSDVSDMEGLRLNVLSSKALGFEGMGAVHPRQVPVINRGFAPDEAEIEKSKNIVIAFEEARRKGLGVVALGSKMIDRPVVARAQKTIDIAILNGRLSKRWKEETEGGINK